MNEIAKTDTVQLPAEGSPQGMIAVINRAMTDPGIDAAKLHSLMDLQERMMAKQAEIEFNLDLQELQNTMPRITKDSKIEHKGVLISNYASYETIDAAIRPLLQTHGFSLRYNSEPSNGKILISGTLAHRSGHSVTSKIELSTDASGAKNNVQGVGSTIAYGKRYLIGMLLNLVFCGEDDDGVKAGHVAITQEQATEIEFLIGDAGADLTRFLAWLGAPDIKGIASKDYDRAITQLKKKKVDAK